MKKNFNLFLALSILALWVGTFEPALAQEDITISVLRPLMAPPEAKLWDVGMAPFLAEHPNIKVKWITTDPGEYRKKEGIMIAGGVPADVMFCFGDDLHFYMSKGATLNLKPYIEKEKFDYEKYYYPVLIKSFFIREGIHGFPLEAPMIGILAYNKDMFNEVGVKYPDESWTWDDLVENAKKLTKTDPRGKIAQFGIGVTFALGESKCDLFVLANGGRKYNDEGTKCVFNSPQAVEAFQWMVDFAWKHHVAPTPAEMLPDANSMFLIGKEAMVICNWFPHVALMYKPNIKKFDWDIALIPKSPRTGKRVTLAGGGGFVVSSQTKHPYQAYQVAKAMSSEEYNVAIWKKFPAQVGIPPGPTEYWPELTEIFLSQPAPPKNLQVAIDSWKYATSGKSHPMNTQIDSQAGAELDPFFNGKITAKEALDKYVEKANRILEEWLKER